MQINLEKTQYEIEDGKLVIDINDGLKKELNKCGIQVGWKKLEPIRGGHGGCFNCGYQYDVAPMDMMIAVGFGTALVTKNERIIYDERKVDAGDWSDYWTTKKAEEQAAKDPDNDWRIVMNGAMRGRTYQRQGEKLWVLIDKNNGFA